MNNICRNKENGINAKYNSSVTAGITLIALVITIIIMLILAGVSIAVLTGDNGLISKTLLAKEEAKISELQEKLELKKIEYVTDKNENNIGLNEYIDYIIDKKLIDNKDVAETGEENSKYVTLEDKYVFLVEKILETGELKITYQGKVGKLKPIIVNIEVLEKSTNSIKVQVNTRLTQNETYIYYIAEEDEEYEKIKETESNTYEYIGLEQGKKYKIKVEVEIKNGEKSSYEIKEELAEINITEYKDITIVEGNKGTPTLTYTGTAKSKSFASSNTSVAIINESTGEVTGVSAGTATMTVTIKNYDNITVTKICTVTVQTAVAKIGSTNYSNVTNAVSAASTSTITLLINQTENVTIPAGKNITLELNNKTINGNITNNGTIVIQGGTIYNQSDIAISNNSVCTINSGNIKSNIRAINNKGTLYIKGGLIETSGGYTVLNESGAKINMTNGEIKRTGNSDNGAAVFSYGTVGMTGGTINSVTNGIVSRGGYTQIKNSKLISTSLESNEMVLRADEGGIIVVFNSTINASLTVSATGDKGTIMLYNSTVTGNMDSHTITITNITGGIKLSVYGLGGTSYCFPTWTAYNEQDDIIWYQATKETTVNGVAWSTNIYKSEHNNETENYITHVYHGEQYDTNNWILGFGYNIE